MKTDDSNFNPQLASKPRVFTFANVMATVALFVSLGGTSYAASKVLITGKNIKNNSIQAIDIKNGTIDKTDLSAATKTSLKGLTGAQGPAGPAGSRGDAAQIKSGFAQYNSGKYINPGGTNPNGGAAAWYQYGVNSNNTSGETDIELSSTPIDNGSATVLSLESNGTSAIGPVNFNSNLTGIGNVTLLHRGTVHTRAECQMYMTDSIGTGPRAMGEATYASSSLNNEMIALSIVGSKNLTASASNPLLYNVMVQCRSADNTGDAADTWEVVNGNVAAYAASR